MIVRLIRASVGLSALKMIRLAHCCLAPWLTGWWVRLATGGVLMKRTIHIKRERELGSENGGKR
jgi:hypothetical protein